MTPDKDKYAVIDTKSGYVLSLHTKQHRAEEEFRKVVTAILAEGDLTGLMPWLPRDARAAEVGPYLAVMRVDSSARPMQMYAGKMSHPIPTPAHTYAKLPTKKTA